MGYRGLANDLILSYLTHQVRDSFKLWQPQKPDTGGRKASHHQPTTTIFCLKSKQNPLNLNDLQSL